MPKGTFNDSSKTIIYLIEEQSTIMIPHRKSSTKKIMNNWFNPIIFQIGPFQARWYGLMYSITFLLAFFYLRYSTVASKLKQAEKESLLLSTIMGVVLGGRIGYILFYNLVHYLQNPIDMLKVWEGGMSFHGGLIGVAISCLWFCKKYHHSYLSIGDILAGYAPVGVFFVRIGNFLNGELYGRIATNFCLHFPGDPGNCRYPSQLLQAFLEGLMLFIILYLLQKKKGKTGTITSWFLILYGVFRIIAEFFREPDKQIGFLFNVITEGQLLSIFMIIVGIILFAFTHKKKNLPIS